MGGRVKIPNLTNNSPDALVFWAFMLAPFGFAVLYASSKLVGLLPTFSPIFDPERETVLQFNARLINTILVDAALFFGVGRTEPSPFRWLAYFVTFTVGFPFCVVTVVFAFTFILGAVTLQEMDFALDVLRGFAGLVPAVIVPLPAGWPG